MNASPNIIFILADDMGYGDVGCYGSTKVPTPHMDRLAREGMRFTDAHASSAVCTPSRYSILTGRCCWRSRLKAWVLGGFGRPLIEADRMTTASLLRSHGYATAAVGKWHLGLDWTLKHCGPDADDPDRVSLDGFDVDYSAGVGGGPTERGFDYWFGISGSLDMAPYCFIENAHTVGIPDREKEYYYNQQSHGMQTPDWRDEEVDITFARKSVAFIEEHVRAQPGQPFFLHLATASPHRPCDVRPDFVEGRSQAGDRGDMVFLFDWVVGEIMDALRRLGLEENTLLIVTSDNGARATCANGRDYGHRSNGDWRGQKADIWDGGHREPLIVRWPGRVRPGSTCDDLVGLGDFLATCAHLLGRELPPNAGEDSYSFLPALLGQEGRKGRDTLVLHSGDGMFAIREGPWKLIEGLGSGGFSEPQRHEPAEGEAEGQLYNLESDPAETTNLWNERPEVVERLKALLESERRR